MRVTKAMLEETNNYLRQRIASLEKEVRHLTEINKILEESRRKMYSMETLLGTGFSCCETLANSLSHAIRLEKASGGTR